MTEWKPGEIVLGDYTIEKELGRGGMGRVWLVKSNSTNRRFAVKQTLLKDEKHRKAILTELQTWIGLPEHRNIVPCRFIRTVEDEIVIFADYVEGGSLADWIAKGKLIRLEQILDVAIQFAWGLHAIHEHGLIHQDVKPGNVLMTADGVPMVTDFGLARARLQNAAGGFVSPALPFGQRSILVSYGGMTPTYASPEQYAGWPLSRKTDIWSWGVSVMDMFMGGVSCPHGGHIAADVLEAFIEIGRKEEALPKMPEEVAAALKKCFEPEQISRWTDIGAVADQLSAIFPVCVGYAYIRSAPLLESQQGGSPYIRRDYSGGGWRDPQQWLSVAHAMAGDDMLRVSVVAQEPHKSRLASAVSDLAKYREACGILVGLAAAGEINAAKQLCELCFEMAHIHGELNDVHGEMVAYDQCIQYAEIVSKESAIVAYADMMMAYAFDQKALRYRIGGDIKRALQHYNESIRHWQQLSATHPDTASFKANYAMTLRNTAVALRNAGDLVGAIALYDEVIEILSRLMKQQNSSEYSSLRMSLQQTLRFKGVALRKAGRVSESHECYAQAMVLLQEMAATRSDSELNIEFARLYEVWACALPPVEAIDRFKKAIKLYEKLVRDYSMNNLLVDLAGAYCSCCGPLSATGFLDDALAFCAQSLQIWEDVVNRTGKHEYLHRYYEARLTRISILFQKGGKSLAEADVLVLARDLHSAISSTGNKKLEALYTIGRVNGYWS